VSIDNDLDSAAATNQPAPKGWEEYAETIGQIGSAIVKLPRPKSSETDLLTTAGFDPKEWKIKGPVQTRRWMNYSGDWLYYFKFDVVQGESEEVKQADVEEMAKFLRERKPASMNAETDGDCFAFFMSDLQIGKVSQGITSQDIVNWYVSCVDQAAARVDHLREAGHKMPHGAIIGLGDIVENCFGHYANQQYLIDMNQREQNKIARELLRYTINALGPKFDKLTVAAIGGNHGERREGGKIKTDDGDNMDLEVFDAVKEAYTLANIDIDWQIADQDLSMALNLGGTNVGITHGHTFRGGINSGEKAKKWMKDQIWGLQEVRECTVLVHGHFHHLSVLQAGLRHLIQAPALDAGSKWFTDSSGEESEPGVLTMRFTSDHSFGYDDLKVLSPVRK
jgi:predicted phosphodiesterase